MKAPCPAPRSSFRSSGSSRPVEFLAAVSHELRTPLQTILGYGELLHRDAADAATAERVGAIREHGELMLRLVNDLLDLTAIQAGGFRIEKRPTQLDALLRQTTESFRPRIVAKGLGLSCRIELPGAAWFLTDGSRLRQIVLNLVGNAEKYTQRGRIDVSLRVKPRASADDCCDLELIVSDTGPGISPADQAKLFRPFTRLASAAGQEGAGLGLALTAALCRRLGGTLVAESDGRSGSCFRVQLPIRRCAPPAEPRRASSATLRGQRILIADDNALVRKLFLSHLTALGADCEVVRDGEAAVQRTLERDFDALVLDVSMPGIDGLEVTRRIRARGGEALRIVGVSAHTSASDQARARAAGMSAVLPKPVDLARLAQAISPGQASPRATAPDMREVLRRSFRAEVAGQHASIVEAWQDRHWSDLRYHAHYLRGSASVVGDDRLYAACAALEDAAENQQVRRCAQTWPEFQQAVAPWLGGAIDYKYI